MIVDSSCGCSPVIPNSSPLDHMVGALNALNYQLTARETNKSSSPKNTKTEYTIYLERVA